MSAVEFLPVSAHDAEALVAIRIAAMRESLENIGRFDPLRARKRFLASFLPEHVHKIVVRGEWVGFVALRAADGELLLDHLYLIPTAQKQGVGSEVMAWVNTQSRSHQLPVRVGALRNSASNRFYLRHGFAQINEAEWDNYYLRPLEPRE